MLKAHEMLTRKELSFPIAPSCGYSGGSVVVDGMRHTVSAQTIRKVVAPTPWKLVAVESEDSMRRSRLAAEVLTMLEPRRRTRIPTRVRSRPTWRSRA